MHANSSLIDRNEEEEKLISRNPQHLLKHRGFIFLLGMIVCLILPWWLSWIICLVGFYGFATRYNLIEQSYLLKMTWNHFFSANIKKNRKKSEEENYFGIPTQ
jgi:hypothetical protein